MANKFLKASIELAKTKPFITTGTNGKKYLNFEIHPLQRGVDQYGNTHTISIRYKATDGNYYTEYIGKCKTAEFGQPAQAPAPPAPAQPAAPAPQAPAAPPATAPAAPAAAEEDELPF